MTSSGQDSHHETPRDAAIEEAFGMFVRHVRAPLGFRARVMARIAAESPTLRDRLVRWLSPLWHPFLAGQIPTAAATSEQEHVFHLDEGKLRLTCDWRASYQNRPATLRVAWQANLTRPTDIWVRFTQPNDPTALHSEVRLGEALEGQAVFTEHTLGFDPARHPWALAIVLKEPHG